MPKLKPISAKKLVSVLKKLGYKELRQKGSHLSMVKDNNIVIVPIHSSKEIDGGLLLKMIKKELKITREEFEKLI